MRNNRSILILFSVVESRTSVLERFRGKGKKFGLQQKTANFISQNIDKIHAYLGQFFFLKIS